jgi:hypothetical protein
MSEQLVATFAVIRLSRGQRNDSTWPLISVFYTGAATSSFNYLFNYPHEAEWALFQIHYFSGSLEVPGIEPGI